MRTLLDPRQSSRTGLTPDPTHRSPPLRPRHQPAQRFTPGRRRDRPGRGGERFSAQTSSTKGELDPAPGTLSLASRPPPRISGWRVALTYILRQFGRTPVRSRDDERTASSGDYRWSRKSEGTNLRRLVTAIEATYRVEGDLRREVQADLPAR